MLINHHRYSRSLFYQLALRKFGGMGCIDLTHAVDIWKSIRTAMDTSEGAWLEEDCERDQICTALVKLLQEKGPMLKEYFQLSIDGSGCLIGIPDLLNGYTPLQSEFPFFLLRLATETDWDDEFSCFSGVINELARFYSTLPIFSDNTSQVESIVSSVFFPAFRAYLIPTQSFENVAEATAVGDIVQVTSLEKLYSVFERC